MKNLRKLTVVVLSVALVLTSMTTAFAVDATTLKNADISATLKDLGLYAGTDATDVAAGLDGALTTQDSLIFLSRLFGYNEAATKLTAEEVTVALAKFDDAASISDYAKNVVAYSASNDILSGSPEGDKLFVGAKDTVTAARFATFMLKQMGYEVADYKESVAKLAETKGSKVDATLTGDLIRDDAVGMIYATLTAEKVSGRTIVADIVGSNADLKAKAEKLGLVEPEIKPYPPEGSKDRDSIVIPELIIVEEQLAPTELAGVAPTTYGGTDGKITYVDATMEYKLSTATDWTAVEGTEITGLAAGTYKVRYAAKDGYNAGTAAEVVVAEGTKSDQDAPTGLAGVAPTAALNDGKITGTTIAMEYKLATAKDSSYVACSDTETVVAAAGDYVVRLAAKTAFNSGATAAVTVPAYVAPNEEQLAPTGLAGVAPTTYGGTDGKITNVDATMEYKLSTATDWTAVEGTEITGLAAGTYKVRYAAKDGYNAGTVAEVVVAEGTNADQDAPTGLAGVAPTAALNDGKITGTTIAMEYKLATAEDSAYVACSDTETVVAAAGDYVVRLAAKTAFNSGATAAITVPAYVAPQAM